MSFTYNLKQLESIDDVKCIKLYNERGLIGTIPNKEGKRGSLQVYANLLGFDHGNIDVDKAFQGLELFAEHRDEAINNPGKHPNIDYLLEVVKTNNHLYAEVYMKEE